LKRVDIMKYSDNKLLPRGRKNIEVSNKNENILLIQPSFPVISGITGWLGTPLSLLTIAAPLVEKKYAVNILDQRVEHFFYKKLEEFINAKPVCVGITCMTGQNKYVYEIAQFIKKINSKIPIVLGGYHASILPYQTLECPYIDFVIIGRGQTIFLTLIQALSSNQSVNNIAGIGYKREQKIFVNKSTDISEYQEDYSLPYHLILKYFRFYQHLPIETSYGCPHHCSFCSIKSVNPKYVYKKPERILYEIITPFNFQHFENITFIDDNFFANVRHAKRILSILHKKRFIYPINATARVDDILMISDKDLTAFNYCGLGDISIGVESGSERILTLLNKQISIKQIFQVNKKLAKLKFNSSLLFMQGIPTESRKERNMTLNLIAKLLSQNKRVTVYIFNYTPYPGTMIYDLAIKSGYKIRNHFEDWSFTGGYREISADDFICARFSIQGNLSWIENNSDCIIIR
jgi:anaerobic magnesium-protoporphyrin IX monomethyl ester cyclase